jgi:chloramphenicol-sensitive protein RarD
LPVPLPCAGRTWSCDESSTCRPRHRLVRTGLFLFAFLSGYTRLLAPLDGTDIFAWRILITLLCVIGLLAWRGELPRLRAAMGELLASPASVALLVLMAALLALQQWLFLWGSVNGRALEVSLGYFMLPLSMVLVGRFHYGEKMDLLQRLAVLCACIGVAHELWMTRAFSWPTWRWRWAIRPTSSCAGASASTPCSSSRWN